MNATSDLNKGFKFLSAALHQMASTGWKDKLELLIVGQSAPTTPVDVGIPIRFLGVIKDEAVMRQIYSSADVTVLSSLQENLPNSIMESMACGTPVVAFNIGGIPQLVDHNLNGYLAPPFDTSDLARGITTLISNSDTRTRWSQMARQKIATTFDSRIITNSYKSLYEDVLSSRKALPCPAP
jgi:glycosyltransferase involved in cell wall biosynthesis